MRRFHPRYADAVEGRLRECAYLLGREVSGSEQKLERQLSGRAIRERSTAGKRKKYFLKPLDFYLESGIVKLEVLSL